MRSILTSLIGRYFYEINIKNLIVSIFKCVMGDFWQGFGVDTHYRSAIFYANEEQKKHALQTKIEHQMKLNRRIVTKILPYSTDFFFLAENQHQKYYLQKDYIRICESLNLRSTQQFIDSSVACKLNGYVNVVAVPEDDLFLERNYFFNFFFG